MRRLIFIALAVALVVPLIVMGTGCAAPKKPEKEVTIGHKYFTENEVLAKLAGYYLEDKGFDVSYKGMFASLGLLEGMKKRRN